MRRPLVTGLVVALLGLGASGCNSDARQGNQGGDPVGVTSPTPTSTGGSGTATSAVPPSATSTVGTIPDPSSTPDVDASPSTGAAPGATATTP